MDHKELDVIESKLPATRTNIVTYIVIGLFGGLVAAMTTSIFGFGYFAILAAYSLGGAISILVFAAFIVKNYKIRYRWSRKAPRTRRHVESYIEK